MKMAYILDLLVRKKRQYKKLDRQVEIV
jgi:hypothetical protein